MNLPEKLFLISLVLGYTMEAPAYTLFSEGNATRVRQWPPSSLDGTLTGLGYPDAALPAQWRLNTDGSDDVEFSVVSGIVDDVIAAWNSVSGIPTLYGREADGPADRFTSDNLNSIAWLETNWAATTGVSASALAFAQSATFSDDYQAYNDILFNGDTHEWSHSGTVGAFDIQAVLTHEMGHTSGLDHSTIIGSTMFPKSASIGQAGNSATRPRTLSADDAAGAQAIYGLPSDTGTITGTIDSDTGGQAMAVVAINSVTGDSIAAFTGNGIIGTANEDYTIAGLPAGSYIVATYPLDGGIVSFVPGNIGLFSNMDTTFESRFYSSSSPTGTADPASVSLVTVTASATTSGVDIDPPDTIGTEKFYYTAEVVNGAAPGGTTLESSVDTIFFGYSDTSAAPIPTFIGPSGTTASTPIDTGFQFNGAGIFGENIGIFSTTVTSTDSTVGALRTFIMSYNGTSNFSILPGAVEMDFFVAPNTAPSIAIAGNVAMTQDETITPDTNIGTVSDTEDMASTLSVFVTSISPTPPAPADLVVGVTNTSGNVIVSSVAATCDLPAAVYTVTVEVEDSGTLTSTGTFDIVVTANPAPTLGAYTGASPIPQRALGVTVSPAAAPADSNANIATVSISPTDFAGTGSASVNPASGEVTFNTTALTPVSTYNFTVIVTDDCGEMASQIFSQEIRMMTSVDSWLVQ